MKSRSKRKKKVGAGRSQNTTARPPLDPLRTGMPAVDSITSVDEFRKGKKVFRVIHTDEVDEYERAPSKPRRKSGDGTAR